MSISEKNTYDMWINWDCSGKLSFQGPFIMNVKMGKKGPV